MICGTIAFATRRPEFGVQMYHYFHQQEIEVLTLDCNEAALSGVLSAEPDLIVLDCGEQAVHALAFCRTIRNTYAGPLVLIAPLQQEQFSLLALQLGADLSLCADGSSRLIAENIISLLYRLTSGNREAFLSGTPSNLSSMEFNLLWLLSRKAGQTVSREAIHHELYHTPYNGYDRSIDLYVSRIRQKLGDCPTASTYLKTVRGVGYQFVTPVESVDPTRNQPRKRSATN